MDKMIYWLVLFTGIGLWLAGGLGNLFFDWSEDVSFPVFIIGTGVIFISLIPAKLEERCTAR